MSNVMKTFKEMIIMLSIYFLITSLLKFEQIPQYISNICVALILLMIAGAINEFIKIKENK